MPNPVGCFSKGLPIAKASLAYGEVKQDQKCGAYQRSCPNDNFLSLRKAMSSGEDGVCVKQGTSAIVNAFNGDADNEREFSRGRRLTFDNPLIHRCG